MLNPLPSNSGWSVYGVFDGHGGRRAADFCAISLPNLLSERLPKEMVPEFDKAVKAAVVQAFLEADRQFLDMCSQATPIWRDGCTATMAFIFGETVYTGNAGDSGVVLGRHDAAGKIMAKRLTRDHTPLDVKERQRIEAAGHRVVDGRVNGLLEVSRSIGDCRYKSMGVSARPDVFRCSLQPQTDRFLLLACDGLWKTMSDEQVVAFVDGKLQELVDGKAGDAAHGYQTVVNSLVNQAVLLGSTDNVTCVLVCLDSTKPRLRHSTSNNNTSG